MTDIEIQAELSELQKTLPDSYKETVEMRNLSDGELYIYYEGSKEEREVNELEHYLKVYAKRKAYIKDIIKVEELKASIKYKVEFN